MKNWKRARKFKSALFLKKDSKERGRNLLELKVEEMANELAEKLKKQNIVVQRYRRKKDNSIVLKLDYGVLNSVQIAEDVRENDDLHYKYNVIYKLLDKKITREKNDYGVVVRYFYPFTRKNELLMQVLEDRMKKVLKYGEKNYIFFMKENKAKLEKQTYWELV